MIEITQEMMSAIPQVLYGCASQGCAEEVSHHPEDLVWWAGDSDAKAGFYCRDCLNHHCADDVGPSLKAVLDLEARR